MKYLFFSAVVLLSWVSLASADILYLTDGQKLEGEIIKETGYSYQIKIAGGALYTYYLNEVEKVVTDEELEAQKSLGLPQEVPRPKAELIERLLEANGSRAGMAEILNQVVARVPTEKREAVQQYLKVDEVIKQIIPIYAKHFSEEELKELINFYRSPVGAKYVQTTPQIMEETMMVVGKYFQEKANPALHKE